MRSIIGLPYETAEQIRAGWQWIDEQISVNGLPEELLTTFRLCYQSAVCELICRYYMEGLSQAAFVDTFDDRHIEEMVAAVFECDEGALLESWFHESEEDRTCENTTFWAVVLTSYLRHVAMDEICSDINPELSRRERRQQQTVINMALAIARGIGFMLTAALESFDLVANLPPLPKHLDVDNVEVDLKTKRIVVWELEHVKRV